jgi:ParB family transcriptional regulator, chromosome partitioning protein
VIPQHSSKSNEHYSPPEFPAAARWVMGWIDLDPASCPLANTLVGANHIYTKEMDGFSRPWGGRVWLNPPGGKVNKHGEEVKAGPGQSNMLRWWYRLVDGWLDGTIYQATFLMFQLSLVQRAQERTPSPLDFPMCFPSQRMCFWKPDPVTGLLVQSKDPTHPNAVVYLPPRDNLVGASARFEQGFQHLGKVILPRWSHG